MITNPNPLKMGTIVRDVDGGTTQGDPIQSSIVSLAYATTVMLDCRVGRDFAISVLTGDITIGWENPQLGYQGSVIVRQEGVGGGTRAVTLIAPVPYTLMRDSANATLEAAIGNNAFTIYQWVFTAVDPTPILLVSKIMAAAP